MRNLFRVGLGAVGLLAAGASELGGLGCSSDDPAATAEDAGAQPDAAAPPGDAAAPPADSAPPRRDCAADLDTDEVPKHLDCTGLYSDPQAKTVAPDNRAYAPAHELWSDGATKARFLYLPAGAKIDAAAFDDWKFPAGTKAWKEFSLDGKRVETRLYWKIDASAWRRVVYRWNAAETEAVRLEAGETIARPGKPDYEVPAAGVCVSCHAARTEPLLGVEAVSLGLAGATGLTLGALASEGRLSVAPPATQLTIPEDGTTKAAAALGWLHANCGSCHNPSPSAGAAFTNLHMQLRPQQLLADGGAPAVTDLDAYKTAVCVAANRSDPDAGTPYKRIAGGQPGASLVSILSGARAPDGGAPTAAVQMPPLVSRAVDTVGHGQLDAWIAALAPCP